MRMRMVVAAVVLIGLVLSGCGGSSKKPSGAGAGGAGAGGAGAGGGAAGTAITVQKFCLSPTPLRAPSGSTITVTDKDGSQHTVTSDDKTSFDTGHIPSSGGTKSFTAPS